MARVKNFQRALKEDRLDIVAGYFSYPCKQYASHEAVMLYSDEDLIEHFDAIFTSAYAA